MRNVQDWFEYNGKIYPTGTIIKTKENLYATFLYWIPKIEGFKATYHYIINGQRKTITEELFYSKLINEVTSKIDNRYQSIVDEKIARDNFNNRKHTFKEELSLNGMFETFILYLFIMTFCVICKNPLWEWSWATLVFLYYREKKLEKMGWKK